MKKSIIVLLLGLLTLVGCARLISDEDGWICTNQGWVKHGNPSALMPSEPCPAESAKTEPSAQLANPASVNCVKNGGRLEIRNSKPGQYGVCLFEDNRQCEEWALMRGQCPVGGLKITGYDNDAEIYCAITGGQVEGVGTATPMCKRIDGTLCNAQANLDGECPNPNDPNPNAGNVEAP